MTTKAEIIQSIKETDPRVILAKLIDEDTRAQFVDLDFQLAGSMDNPFEVVTAAIEHVPSSLWAQYDYFEELASKLLEKCNHYAVLSAISGRIVGMTLDEYDLQASKGGSNWINNFSLNARVNQIPFAEKYIEPVRNYIYSASRYHEASNFLGRPVDSITRDSFKNAIKATDPQELLAALSDRERFASLNRISDADYGELVALAINTIPVELWPHGKNLIDTFDNLLQYRSPRVLEAIIKVIENLPDENLLSQVKTGNDQTFGNHLAQWAHSPNVRSIASGSFEYLPRVNDGSNPISSMIYERISQAQAKLAQEQLFGNIAPATAPASTGLGATFTL